MKRPDWDTYFIDIAHVVARRSNCCRRHVAALIVLEKRIISTGYNGTPRGIKNCYEGGCPRCAGKSKSGANLGDCICAHAEENAIVQAAFHGISVRLVAHENMVLRDQTDNRIVDGGLGESYLHRALFIAERSRYCYVAVQCLSKDLVTEADSHDGDIS